MQSAASGRPTQQYRGAFNNFIDVVYQNVLRSSMKFPCHREQMIGKNKDLAKNISEIRLSTEELPSNSTQNALETKVSKCDGSIRK